MRRSVILSIAMMLVVGPAAYGHAQPRPLHSRKTAAQMIPTLPPLMTTYDVYVGGIHFLTANILFEEQHGHYQTDVKAHTAGFAASMLPWHSEIMSEGRIESGRFVPASYSNLDTWRNKPKATHLRFDGKGNVRADFEPPGNDKKTGSVTDAQKRGALDPVTGLLQMLAYESAKGSCDVKVPVFDGKRRFDLTGQDGGSGMIDEEDYGSYKGPARTCDVGFDLIAGEWKANNRFWQSAKGENSRAPFHIWLAHVAPGVPELPVRLESDSVWGLIIVHLTDWHYATSDELKP